MNAETNPTTTVPSWTPPKWVNSMMTAMLRTPGLQRLLGRRTALLTVTGRKTGKRYTTPVTYFREEDTVLVVTRRVRTWWRNLDTNREVELRLAGRPYQGRARLRVGDRAGLDDLSAFLEHRRRDAKAYGIGFTTDGHIDEDQALAVLPYLVIIRITLTAARARA